MKIILASNSPRRKELLRRISKEFETIASNLDENTIKEEQPEELVKKLAISKAREVFERVQQNYRELIVIGGDTVVYFNGKILGKPKSEEDACNMLKELQNNVNYVYSGLAVITKKMEELLRKMTIQKQRYILKK